MVGSKKYFGYLDDTGRQWACQLDESVYEQLGLGFAQTVLPATISDGRILKMSSRTPLEPRYVIAKRVDANGQTHTRKFFIGDPTTAFWVSAGAGVSITGDDGEIYQVTYYSGEKRTVVPTVDTALTDGDADANVAGP